MQFPSSVGMLQLHLSCSSCGCHARPSSDWSSLSSSLDFPILSGPSISLLLLKHRCMPCPLTPFLYRLVRLLRTVRTDLANNHRPQRHEVAFCQLSFVPELSLIQVLPMLPKVPLSGQVLYRFFLISSSLRLFYILATSDRLHVFLNYHTCPWEHQLHRLFSLLHPDHLRHATEGVSVIER